MCKGGCRAKRDWGIVCIEKDKQMTGMTIPPSALWAATSLCTREARVRFCDFNKCLHIIMYICRGCEKIRHNQWYDLCYNPITKCTMKPQITGIFICIFPSCTKGGKTIIIFNVVKYTEACQQNRRERSGFGFDRRSNGMDELSSVVTEANDIKFASTKS